ncbi:hypothetical protein ACFYP4_16650 [Streptomyces sp. NPDC005551]|uniref:hypothetical protein n=1 Tax=Streptomyces sp. NPDC005551 TaxID=3364725 RepID=UPI0036C61982
MKKRTMLAVASLATGFVVAAVTPSHALGGDALGDLHLERTLSNVDHTVSSDSLDMEEGVLDQDG